MDLTSLIKSSKPLSNLVPTTASANYATLTVIELHIKELLTSNKTAAISF
ncbi:MAG: hypothetical protein ACRC0B_07335 [Legionella sp.]